MSKTTFKQQIKPLQSSVKEAFYKGRISRGLLIDVESALHNLPLTLSQRLYLEAMRDALISMYRQGIYC